METIQILSLLASYSVYIILSLVLVTQVYHQLFDPLRRYPGPFIARFTNGYAGYFALRKRLHLTTHQNLEKYGPVIRQAPNRLVFNTVAALHDIYLSPGITKGEAYRSSQLQAKYPSMINAIDKDQHRRKRKYIGPALSERSMRNFEPVMEEQIDIFLNLLLASARAGETVNMTERCRRLGLDIIGLLSFGYPFATQTGDSFGFLPGVIAAMSWRISLYMQFPLLRALEYPLLWLAKKQATRFGDTISSVIKTRTAQPKDAHHDLYSMVADHIGKGQQSLYRGELWPEAILFIIAGGTTTATAMTSLFFYLAQNPLAGSRLKAEIRSTFSSASEIRSGPELMTRCKYLRACIDEALRMTPPTLTIPWRQQPETGRSNEPFVVDGHVIPPGTQVGVSLYSLLHHPEYFPDPFVFSPERWLVDDNDGGDDGGESSSGANANKYRAFAPFLIGDRACAGRSMAYLELSLALARAIWFFDWEFAPGPAGDVGRGETGRTDGRGRRDEFQVEDIFVSAYDGPNLIFTAREEVCEELEKMRK
ncbi:cytochrome P450 [Nemania sp. FL0916]|nr:cytochrome P450 [Nemania sp. FL0916]